MMGMKGMKGLKWVRGMNPGIDDVFIISLNNEYACYDANVYYI